MKVEVEGVEDFRPIKITLTIESQAEFNAIKEMAFWDDSIPAICQKQDREYVSSFLRLLHDKLYELTNKNKVK